MKKPYAGVQATAETLNLLDAEHQEKLLRSIEEKDPALAEALRLAMFTFADVFKLEDSAVQSVIREVPSRTLATALRGAAPAILDAVFRQMSTRAGEALREEIESVGPQPVEKVRAAQKDIILLAKRFQPT